MDTLLLSRWEAGKTCELKVFNATGQEVPTEIVEMTTIVNEAGSQDMTITACTGTGITSVDRKIHSAINYVARIVKKADVQTWSEAEAHLWEEYDKYWNTPKPNA